MHRCLNILQTFLEIRPSLPSLTILSMAPFSCMVSISAETNSPSVFIPMASQYFLDNPTNSWAHVVPSSIAGVSEKMVSVATDSCLRCTFRAGKGDLKVLQMCPVIQPDWAYCVVEPNVFLVTSVGTCKKYCCKAS